MKIDLLSCGKQKSNAMKMDLLSCGKRKSNTVKIIFCIKTAGGYDEGPKLDAGP
jgi:hypothetical protein